MKNRKINYLKYTFLLGLVFLTNVNCERDLSEDAKPATFVKTAEIFTDDFVGMGTDFYFPYNDGYAKPDIFEVDTDVSYEGSASLRIDVPNALNDPAGSYAGAFFRVDGAGRDLSDYDALTFWVKSTGAPFIESFGFGQSEDVSNQVSISNFQLSTTWTKVIIPIPDASKLTNERGMFWLVALPDGGNGYSFWIDELKFEKLGTIGQKRPFIFNSLDVNGVAFVGETLAINDIGVKFNLANGTDVSIKASSNYFTFSSSNDLVAQANQSIVSMIGPGNAIVTAKLGSVDADGSLNVSSIGLAPTPTLDPSNVISIFSDAYINRPVDYFNGYWTYSTTQGQDDININGNNIIKYTNTNFVGTEFQGSKTINASAMTHFHIDIYVEDVIQPGDFIRIQLQDLGADNVFGGGNDKQGSFTLNSSSIPAITNNGWISIDVPFSSFPGLSTRSNLAQIVYVTEGTNPNAVGNIKNFFVDNIYFHN